MKAVAAKKRQGVCFCNASKINGARETSLTTGICYDVSRASALTTADIIMLAASQKVNKDGANSLPALSRLSPAGYR